MNRFKTVLLAALLALAPFTGAAGKPVPTEDFFRASQVSSVSLSPTGEYMTVSSVQEDRTVLAAFRVSDMKLVGKWDYGERKHIDRVVWVGPERLLMYVSFKIGTYDFRLGNADVYASNVDGTRRADMPGLRTYQIAHAMPEDPRYILVQRSVESAFLSRYDTFTGEVRTVATAPLRAADFILDHERNVRYAVGITEKQEQVTLRRDGERWVTIHKADMGGDVREPIIFHPDGKRVYFSISRDGQPSGIYLVDPETNEETLVRSNPNVDTYAALVSSDRRTLLGSLTADGIPSYSFIDREHEESKVYAGLINAFPDHVVTFRGISQDGRYILFNASSDIDPGTYYLFDRKDAKAKFLIAARPWIKPEQMSAMEPVSFKARDGKTVHGFLTLPANRGQAKVPLVVNIHGGPIGIRDSWGFNPEAQFLASRGYAVLQVNFRGSGGYGPGFQRAGFKQWGAGMIDDITDGVDYVLSRGQVDPARICTYGGSYGAYAALHSVVRNAGKYKCTVGYVGVYDQSLILSDGSVGDPTTRAFFDNTFAETAAERDAQSPLKNVAKINVPVMLVHGGMDEIAPMVHYNQMKKALERIGNPPKVAIVEKKEGHGFQNLENNVRFYDAMHEFFNTSIGEGAKPASAN